MIELLFVMAILAILLTVAFTAYQRVIMERRVQNVTRELAADIRVAQQAAVAKSAEAKCVGVAFGAMRAGVYVVPEGAGFACQSPTAAQLAGYGILLSSHDYPVGVTVQTTPGDAIVFVPSGSPYPTCTGADCTGFRVTVSGGTHTRRVCVGSAGLVTVPPPGAPCPGGGG